MPPDLIGGDGPYFFLAYAHTPERRWVEKLFRDLQAEVLERTTWPVNATVGFMDGSAIPLGGDWPDEVARALATCKVFVPLYSPRYFTREECGKEWHAFSQRILDHRARHAGDPAPIVPALWTPVDARDMPEAARRIQMNHADLGDDYAKEGFYTLIKNSFYRQEYLTAVQKLAQHIITAAQTSQLRPCQVRDFGPPRNAFERIARTAPADRRLHFIVAAPTIDRLPPGRTKSYYGHSPGDWNPYHPSSRQPLAEFAAAVARLDSYEPSVLGFDEGCAFLAERDPAAGLGVLLIDAWAAADDDMAARLRKLDALDLGWVGTMVPWNLEDPQLRSRGEALREALAASLPNRFGGGRQFTPVNAGKVISLEQFRTRLPEVLEGALFRYLNHVDAHPPVGEIAPRPRLAGPDDRGAVR